MALLLPNFVNNRQKSSGHSHFGFIGAFVAGQPFKEAAEIKVRPDGRPDSFHRRPAQPPVPRPQNLPVIRPVAGAVDRRNDPGVGMKMSRIGEPMDVCYLHRHQHR